MDARVPGRPDGGHAADHYGGRSLLPIWLIGLDGKVVAKDLRRGEAIQDAVARALKEPR